MCVCFFIGITLEYIALTGKKKIFLGGCELLTWVMGTKLRSSARVLM